MKANIKDYKGLIDRHLNVFCGYGNDHLENNITKAFVNVLSSLAYQDLKKVLEDLVGVTLPETETYADFYLQRRPPRRVIESIPEEKRILFAFSPTGKSYPAPDGLDGNDRAAVKKYLDGFVRNENPGLERDDIEAEVEKRCEDFFSKHDHDSIPDGWVLIYEKDKPVLLIAMENKLYNLNPYQLKNHLKNGMFCSEAHMPIYSTFEAIVRALDGSNTYLAAQFHEYLVILGYIKLELDLIEAAGIDREIRRRFLTEPTRRFLGKLFPGNEVDLRHNRTPRIKVDLPILKEINLEMLDEGLNFSMALGPKKDSARFYFQCFSLEDIDALQRIEHVQRPYQTLHGLYLRGRNTGYLKRGEFKGTYGDYFQYWKNHIDDIHAYDPPVGCISSYEAMQKEGLVDASTVTRLKDFYSPKKNPISLVPETIINIFWSYEEITEYGSDEDLLKSMKATLNKFLGIISKARIER